MGRAQYKKPAGSRLLPIPALAAIASLVFLGGLAWLVAHDVRDRNRENVASVLQTVLNLSHQAITTWARDQQREALLWAGNPAVVERAAALLHLKRQSQDLMTSSAQVGLRDVLRPVMTTMRYRGYFLIAPDGTNIASSRDSNIGEMNLLVEQDRFLARIWDGGTAVSLPQASDVPLRDNSGALASGLSSMFVGAPVRNSSGHIIAAFTFRLDPADDFSIILQRGRVAQSGETYAFDRSGKMISESRFLREARKAGVRTQGVQTRMTRDATAGNSGQDLEGYADYRGVPVVGAWLWDPALDFGIASELDLSEAYASTQSLVEGLALTVVLLSLSIGGVTALALRGRQLQHQRGKAVAQRQLLAELLENLSHGVVMFNAQRQLVAWNDSYRRMLGFPDGYLAPGLPNSAMARHLAERGFYGEGDVDALVEERMEFLWSGHDSRKDGLFYENRFYDVITHGTEDGGLIISYTDITERKTFEHRIEQQKVELDRLNRQKTQLFTVISHDLRSPLGTLLGYANMLQEMSGELSPAKVREYCNAISEGGRQALDLMENLLEWARTQLDQYSYNPGPVHLRELTDQTLALHRLSAQSKNIRLESHVEDLHVHADADMVLAILRNLVGNAIKFTPASGLVSITARSRGEIVEISVSDNGVGLRPERIETLFDPDSKTSTPGTAGESGTGLGLLLCKEYVDQHGGSIDVESHLGEGTTFRFTLPASTPDADAEKVEDLPRISGGG